MACPDTNKTFQLSGHVTIDNSQNDFLQTAKARCEKVPGHVQTHADRDTAVAHCLAKLGEVNIVGHGDVGIIGTGCGEHKGGPSTFMNINRLGNWATQHQITSLRLVSCHTGGDQQGADFLFELAKVTGVTVCAPAGFVFIGQGCEDFYLDPKNDNWQEATPQRRPEKISSGEHRRTFQPMLRLAVGNDFVPIESHDVRTASVDALVDRIDRLIGEWKGRDATDAISSVDFARPMLRGFPAAFVTGSFDLSFIKNGEEIHRRFLIYNNRLLRDEQFERVYYRADIPALLLG